MVIQSAAHSGDAHSAGRQLLARMYWDMTGQEQPAIAVTPMGKPYFPGNGIHFSISHTKDFVFCVLSDKPVGIDAEPLDRKIDLRLADKILSPAERVFYDGAEDQRQALLRFWVLKEAAGKCSGEGLRIWPDHTAFSPDDKRIQIIEGCLVAVIEEQENNYAF